MLHYIRRNIQEMPFILCRDEHASSSIIHPDLQRFGEGTNCLDVTLNALIAHHQQSRKHRLLHKRRVDGHDQSYACITRDMIAEEIDALDMEVGGLEGLSNAHADLMAFDIGESPLDRFSGFAVCSTSHLQLGCTTSTSNLQAEKSCFALIVNRCSIDRSRSEWVLRDDPCRPALVRQRIALPWIRYQYGRMKSDGTRRIPSF